MLYIFSSKKEQIAHPCLQTGLLMKICRQWKIKVKNICIETFQQLSTASLESVGNFAKLVGEKLLEKHFIKFIWLCEQTPCLLFLLAASLHSHLLFLNLRNRVLETNEASQSQK